MTIYRLENSYGHGPYGAFFPDSLRARMFEDHRKLNGKRYRPLPQNDGIVGPFTFPFDHFACDSIKSLKYWFKGYMAGLKRLGFRIVAIELPDHKVRIGIHQVAYDSRFVLNKYNVDDGKPLGRGIWEQISPRSNDEELEGVKCHSGMSI